jgi:hypothetical protein
MRSKIIAIVVLILMLSTGLSGQDQFTSATLSSATCPGSGCVTLQIANGATAAIQITGTWVGVQTFQATVDGTTFFQIPNTIPATANGMWTFSVAGFRAVRVRTTTFTSGSAVVSLRVSTASTGIIASRSVTGTMASSGTSFDIDTTGMATLIGYENTNATAQYSLYGSADGVNFYDIIPVTQPGSAGQGYPDIQRTTVIQSMFKANVAGHAMVRLSRFGGTGSANWTFGLSPAPYNTGSSVVVFGPNGNGITVDGSGLLKVDASGTNLNVSGIDTESGSPSAFHLNVGGIYNDSMAAVTPSARTGGFRITPNHALHVNLRDQSGAELTSLPVTGTFFQAIQPVSGTFWQATQPVSIATMPSTPVTGTFWQTTQPISGTVTATGPVTDTQLRATPVPVSGTVTATTGGLTDTQLRASGVGILGVPLTATGTITANAQNVTINMSAASYGTVGISNTGTWNGALTAQTSVDGTNWADTVACDTSSGTCSAILVPSTTSVANVSGAHSFRILSSAGTTGTTTINLRATSMSANMIRLSNAVSLAGAPTVSLAFGTEVNQNVLSTWNVALASVPTHAVTGPVTDTQLRASAVPVSLATVPSHAVTIATLPALTAGSAVIGHVINDTGSTTAVTGTVAVSGPITDTQIRATPLPVTGTMTANAVISTVNSSTATLGIGAVFTGTSEDITEYADIRVYVFADQASATDGLSIQQSSNGTNWDVTDVYTIPASTGKTFSVPASAKFYRVVYTNGGVANTAFRLQTIFRKVVTKSSSVRPQDARTNDNDMEEAAAYISGFNGTTWDRIRSGGNNNDAEAVATTGQLDVEAHNMAYNGATWDRIRTSVKGTQATTALATQDLKDSGRTSVMITATVASTATAETLITLTRSVGLAATGTCSSCTITTGKRFRIQSIAISARKSTGTVAANVTVNFRAAVAGATTAASPLQMHFMAPLPASAVAVLFPPIMIPDGFEIDSNSATNTFGMTITDPGWVTAAQISTFDITLVGYEY